MRVHQRSRRSHARAGVTLLEVVMASGLLVLALGSVAMMSSTTESAYKTASAALQIEQNLHRALQRTANELATTGPGYLNPPNPAQGLAFSQLDFQRVTGNNGAAATLGSMDRIAMELAEGELDDGIDNDGDGLVDEQSLVMRTRVGTADEKRIVLCNHVLEFLEGENENGADDNGNLLADEPGFHFVRTGDVLTLRLSAAGFDHMGFMITRTAEVVVRMRN